MINFNAVPTEQSETVITESFSLENELKKIRIETIREFAREFPNEFVKIAVDEIGEVELAEYLHETYNLLEIYDGLEAEVIEHLEYSSITN